MTGNLPEAPHPQDDGWLPQPPATPASPGFWRGPSIGHEGPLFTHKTLIGFLLPAAVIYTQLFMPLWELPVTDKSRQLDGGSPQGHQENDSPSLGLSNSSLTTCDKV